MLGVDVSLKIYKILMSLRIGFKVKSLKGGKMPLKTEIFNMARKGKISIVTSKIEEKRLSVEEVRELFLKLKRKKPKLSTYRYSVSYPKSSAPNYKVGYALQGTLEGKKYTIEFKIARGKIVVYSVSKT